MGKRSKPSKSSNVEVDVQTIIVRSKKNQKKDDDTTISNEVSENGNKPSIQEKGVKRKKKKIILTEDKQVEVTNCSDVILSDAVKSRKRKNKIKGNKLVIDEVGIKKLKRIVTNEDQVEVPNTSDLTLSKTFKNKKQNNNTATKKNDVKSINKKILFGETESYEAQSGSSHKRINQDLLEDNEDDNIKEEEIDEFCDAITAEDNVQFENWVKLIEAKLHSNNKNKPVY